MRLDTHRIRQKALKDYGKAEKHLEELKNTLKKYHEQDKPGFRSWVHKTFGELMTRQRELFDQIESLNEQIEEIRNLMFRYGLSEVEAYRKFIWRRDHPVEAEKEDRIFDEEVRKEEDAEDDLDDEFEDVFANLFEDLTGQEFPRDEPLTGKPKAEEDKSAKEVYRTIVRRLHPDHHGAMSEAQKNLWHEAQEAYRRRDTNALYSILSRCDSGEAGIGKHSPISLILKLTKQLKSATRSLRAESKVMKHDPAWNFETRSRDPAYVARLRDELEDTTDSMSYQLREIKSLLRELEQAAARTSRPAKRPPRHRHRPQDEYDSQLPF